MILAKIEELGRYAAVSPNLAKAIDWLKSTDLASLEKGKVVIDGTRVFANVSEYATKTVEDAKFETHRNYMDIQICATGAERMDITEESKLTPTNDYDPVKDRQNYAGDADQTVVLLPGWACVVFPEDPHRPCIHPDSKTSTNVKKVCVKVRM